MTIKCFDFNICFPYWHENFRKIRHLQGNPKAKRKRTMIDVQFSHLLIKKNEKRKVLEKSLRFSDCVNEKNIHFWVLI